jgi:hypothetical protein
MLGFVGLLCGWLICAGAAVAQGPETPVAAVPTSPAPPADLAPRLGHPSPGPEGGGVFYAEVEFLLRWFKPVCETPAVVTIGNPADRVPGALGQPGTQVALGQAHKFEFPITPGVQLTVGWDRGDGAIGLEVSGFLMEEAANGQRFAADANGSPNTYLAYQAPDNTFQALPFTIPGVVTGGSVSSGSTRLWGVEGDLSVPFTSDLGRCTLYGKFLAGGRYLDLTDRVRVTNMLRLVADPSAVAFGADQFSTHNQFAGPQLGTTLGLAWGRWSLEYTTKLAAGVTFQSRDIEGTPLLASSVASPLLVPGPLLALPSNIGHESARRVTLVPEVGVKSRLALTSWCSVSLGYSLLYWNKVLCPGDQMSPLANITQLPFHGPVMGPLEPKSPLVHTDYFAQGLNFDIQFAY